MKYLFLGGCADGQWIEVPDHLPDWIVREPANFFDLNITFCYEARKWMTPDQPRYIYVMKDIPKNQVLDLLLKGYKCTTSIPKNM